MKLHVTPDLMRLVYEYLRATPPFRRWKLPPANEIVFVVTRHPTTAGYCRSTYKRPVWEHEIGVSSRMVKRTQNLIEVMAHELVHEHCDRLGVKAHHGGKFQKCCDQVARIHGFNPIQL